MSEILTLKKKNYAGFLDTSSKKRERKRGIFNRTRLSNVRPHNIEEEK